MNAECTIGSPLAPQQRLKARRPPKPIASAAQGVALTRRENELLHALIHGPDSNKDIAHALGLSEGTLKVYLFHIGRKITGGTGMTRVALALWAERRWNDQSGTP
jgi:DNA-binding NarL/FixJ family response regulator